MRVDRPTYDALKKIKSNGGTTQEIAMVELDFILSKHLIRQIGLPTEYRFELTPRGEAAVQDRPLE